VKVNELLNILHFKNGTSGKYLYVNIKTSVVTWNANIFVEEVEVYGRLEPFFIYPFFVNKFRHNFGKIEEEIGDVFGI
jgi:hypothetical protein